MLLNYKYPKFVIQTLIYFPIFLTGFIGFLLGFDIALYILGTSHLLNMWFANIFFYCVVYLFIFFFPSLFRAALVAYGSSQARGKIKAVAASLCHSHSNARSEPYPQPTLELMATPDP